MKWKIKDTLLKAMKSGEYPPFHKFSEEQVEKIKLKTPKVFEHFFEEV
tara:strand:+ start:1424 stop:1567 length:144 start_codon:yes stop_codon:yes gene_type:complete